MCKNVTIMFCVVYFFTCFYEDYKLKVKKLEKSIENHIR